MDKFLGAMCFGDAGIWYFMRWLLSECFLTLLNSKRINESLDCSFCIVKTETLKAIGPGVNLCETGLEVPTIEH